MNREQSHHEKEILWLFPKNGCHLPARLQVPALRGVDLRIEVWPVVEGKSTPDVLARSDIARPRPSLWILGMYKYMADHNIKKGTCKNA